MMKKTGILFLLLSFIIAGNSCHKSEPIPKAVFTYTGTNDFKVPCTVTFENNSTDSFSWAWDFGDGGSSTDKNPIHTYTRAGFFKVVLKAYTESALQWAATTQTIQIKDSIP